MVCGKGVIEWEEDLLIKGGYGYGLKYEASLVRLEEFVDCRKALKSTMYGNSPFIASLHLPLLVISPAGIT